MFKSFFDRFRRNDSAATGLEVSIEAAADRFRGWLGDEGGIALARADEKLNQLHELKGDPGEAVAGDGAAFLGEALREAHSGEWVEDSVYGLVVAGVGGIGHGKFLPLNVIEHKLRVGPGWSLEKLFESIPARLDAERKLPIPVMQDPAEIAARLRGMDAGQCAQTAAEYSERFRQFWRARFPVELPLSLTGVREVDGFLRSHYYLNFLGDVQLIEAGFFLGEVARGLFEGEWKFSESKAAEDAALVWLEIEYFPIGRIYKMMTEQPTGEPLDEYIRLVPSARKEMRETNA